MIKIRDSRLDLLAFIDDYWNDNIHEMINSEFTFDFSTVIDDEKSQYIQEGNIVEIDDNYFEIVYFRKQRTGDNLLLIDVEAWQVAMLDLNSPAYNMDTFTEDGTPENILASILSGTGYTVDTVEFSTVTTFSLQEKASRRGLLVQFAEDMGGELKFDKYEISLLIRRGSDNGVQIRVGKNLRAITKDVDKRDGTTKKSYDIDMIELRTLEEYGDLEAVELGDTIYMIDPDVEVDEKQRIIEYDYSPKRRIESQIIVANHMDGIEDSITKIQRETVIKGKLYYGIRISPEKGFETIRSDGKARSIMNADEFKMQKSDGAGGWVDSLYFDAINEVYKFAGALEAASGSFAGEITAESGSIGGWNIEEDRLSGTGIIEGGQIIGSEINIGSGVFTVDTDGNMVATSASVTGEITAESGTIGGWTIGADALTDTAGLVGMRSEVTAGDDVRFFAGNSTPSIAPFKVTEAGVLTAESGTVGGWTLSATKLSGSGILEGGTVQTAGSGQRIALVNNTLKTFNSSGNLNGFAWGTDVSGGTFGDSYLYHNGSKLVEFFDNVSGYSIRGTSSATSLILGGIASPTVGEGSWDFTDDVTINTGTSLNSITQTDSTATTVAGIVSDFNTLLTNLRSMNILAT